MIRSSRFVGEMSSEKAFEINSSEQIDVDFPAVMERMRRLRSGISHHDYAHRFHKLGVDAFLDSGRFSSDNTIEVNFQDNPSAELYLR